MADDEGQPTLTFHGSLSARTFLLAAMAVAGCVALPVPGRPLEEPIVLDPAYTRYGPGDESGTECISTPEEFLLDAEFEARQRGWTLPLQGKFILRDEGEGQRQVVVDPFTVENLRLSGVRLDQVEWVLLRER